MKKIYLLALFIISNHSFAQLLPSGTSQLMISIDQVVLL